MRYLIVWLLFCSLLLGGCGRQSMAPVAGLAPLPEERLADWGIPQQLSQQGEGNFYRVVTGQGLLAPAALELSTGGNGAITYYVETAAAGDVTASWRLQFLSTQGTGRILLSALDAKGQVIAAAGQVVTGLTPAAGANLHWDSQQYTTNYQGDWLTANVNVHDSLVRRLPGVDLNRAVKYRLNVEIGQGQHVLVTAMNLTTNSTREIKVTVTPGAKLVDWGTTVPVAVAVTNTSGRELQDVTVAFVEPPGLGLISTEAKEQLIPVLQPGQTVQLAWQIKAQRPDAVNLGQPWPLRFTINGHNVSGLAQLAVRDTRPGKIYYVMTEDLEPIDGAGYQQAWGNGNGWLEPRELRVQLIDKPEQLNTIAARYQAKWTHYIAWPVVKAAVWAANQSDTGNWPQTVNEIKQSVRTQADLGHEYSIHLHSDYDPYLPGNTLSYNRSLDGIWANHLRHGWAHSIAREGTNFEDYTSRLGLLYDYMRILMELARESPQGQLVTSRVGSFDFGSGTADEAMSTRVYRHVGLWGSSDADGNAGGATSGEYGKEIYFTQPDDINAPTASLTNIGLVEFRPTPRQFIGYDGQSAATMNNLADQGMALFVGPRGVSPGVHAIIGFTHAMFVMGDGDWQSTQGGQFAAIDDHLRYLKNKYVDNKVLEFATASELVKAYLDYYAPEPVIVYGQELDAGAGITEYPLRILGQDIPIDQQHQHVVTVKYPLYLRDTAYRISILKNGQPIYSTWGLPTPYNDIQITIDDKQAAYTLKVYHNPLIFRVMTVVHAIKARIF